MDLLLSFTSIITTHIAEIAFLHYLLLNKKCFIFCLYISLKFRTFAISFQQLPHSVIDWGTIKNIITNNDSNAYDILDALCISIFAFGYYFSISYCLLWLCCLSFLPAIVFRQFGIAYNLNLQFRIRYVFPKLRLVKLSTFFLTAVFFEMFFYKTTDNGKQTTVGEDGTTDFTENWLCFATPRLQVNETTSTAATTHSLVVC